ncbi:hypothetical protein NKG94_30185 [Micromonospora sp. M12]
MLLTVAALSKNEGLVAAVGVAALVTLRARADLRRAALVWLPVLAGAPGRCWPDFWTPSRTSPTAARVA